MNSKISSLKTAISTTSGRSVLKLKKHSPHILFGAGVVGFVATVGLASRATLKIDEIIDEVDDKRNAMAKARAEHPDNYSEEDAKRDAIILYVHQYKAMLKLYAPSVLVGSLTIAAFTGAHVTLTRRNTAVVAAYASIERAFNAYRSRVIDEFGIEKDREFHYGKQTVVGEVVDEKGKTSSVEKTVAETGGAYSAIFDESNANWSSDPAHTIVFLRAQWTHFNNKLASRGHVFLNEVYDALALPRTSAGAVVGWIKGEENSHISFGIFDAADPSDVTEFLHNPTGGFILDFNPDGIIYDKI